MRVSVGVGVCIYVGGGKGRVWVWVSCVYVRCNEMKDSQEVKDSDI